ncbi:DUF1697 domain-containing protein [Oerskovia sp. Sa1BUA8]|uniref:DUF1697 domain-containing protein n=1 Tax=Oerskovia douganii TaxID=2762210 RepID=A0A9D5YY75_9CELL|nr:DUF1697 domain-containing protein [Oerskovia douganii]MBE7700313.1 DUF1697 domain-containing protein [Oerskovia douganii]
MTSGFAVLLRGVNVGGGRKVPSADLRAVAQDAGFAGARTLLASGNLVVAPGTSGITGPDDVTHLVRAGLRERLGLDVDVLTLTAAELAAAVADNPFPEAARADPSHLLLAFHPHAPTPDRLAALDPARYGVEHMAWSGRVSYTWYEGGVGTSRLTPAVLLRTLGVWGTARNWNTVTRLAALVEDPG